MGWTVLVLCFAKILWWHWLLARGGFSFCVGRCCGFVSYFDLVALCVVPSVVQDALLVGGCFSGG